MNFVVVAERTFNIYMPVYHWSVTTFKYIYTVHDFSYLFAEITIR